MKRFLKYTALTLLILTVGAALFLKNMDGTALKNYLAAEFEKKTGQQIDIGGEFEPSFFPMFGVTVSDVSFPNASWGAAPSLAEIDEMRIAFNPLCFLKGQVCLSRFLLSGVTVHHEEKDGRYNWQSYAAQKKKADRQVEKEKRDASQSMALSIGEVDFEEVIVLRYQDGALEDTYRLDSLILRANGHQAPLTLGLKMTWNEQPLSLEAEFGSIADFLGAKPAFPIALSGRFLGSVFSIEGTVDTPLAFKQADLKISAQLIEPEPLHDFFGLKGATLGGTAIYGDIRLTPDSIAFLPIHIGRGSNDITFLFDVRKLTSLPTVRGRIFFDKLNLAHFFPHTEREKTSQKSDKEALAPLFPDTPVFDLPPLAGTLDIDGGSIALPHGVRLNRIRSKLSFPKKKAAEYDLSFELMESPVKAHFLFEPRPEGALRATAELTSDHFLPADLLFLFDAPPVLENGRASLSWQMAGKGRTWQSLAAGTNGRFLLTAYDMDVRDGKTKKEGVTQNLLTHLLPSLALEDVKRNKVIHCAIANLRVNGGRIISEKSVAVEAERLNLVINGKVRLTDETMDLSVHPSVPGHVDSPLSNFTDMLRIKGTIRKPHVGMDAKATARTVASVGAALATGGISLLGEGLVDSLIKDDAPCQTALKAFSPDKKKKRRKREREAPVSEKIRNFRDTVKKMHSLFGNEDKTDSTEQE